MEIINKVAQSGILTLNLEDLFPSQEIVSFDLKDFLFKELILREKDFREALPKIDWQQYHNKIVAVHCSTDVIIPQWAFMLVSVYAQPYASAVYFGTPENALRMHYACEIERLDINAYTNQRVVIKGCSKKPVPVDAYVLATNKLRPVAKSIMYGEPCSTVPLYKKKEKTSA
ncbi:MAG: DUF2480 family protein [Chitinophagales bacterium]